jgi:2-keto-4-pentenoate hydratase/2-oxohepta-3-ene-1,7-dioic acid hydratase in catechol pathway
VASKEFSNPQDIVLKTHLALQSASVNPLQNGSTKEQLWQIAETVSALSYGTLLKKGDIICTGTPPGQGSSQKPPIWLQHGETVTVWGEGIGSLVNEVEWESKAPGRSKL